MVVVSLGATVRDFRLRAGLTQQELADLAGLSVAGLRDVEQGRVLRPRVSTMRRLSGALGLSATEAEELLRAGVDGTSAPAIWIGVLGTLRVLVDGETVDPGSEAQRVLLGLLALSPNTVVGRDTLIEGVWGTRPPSGAADLLQSRISRLRRRLRPDDRQADRDTPTLIATRGGYRLRIDGDEHDVLTFRRLVARGRRSQQAGELAAAAESFADAVKLWRGEPLSGLPVLASHPVVVGLVAEWQQVVCEYAQVACELGRFEEVLPHLRRVTDADPLHEGAHAQLMIALTGSGQQAAALSVFDALRHRLADELGADPGPDLTHAYQRVLHQEVTRPELTPVSAHRQLPPDIADFSGREAEVEALYRRLPVSPDGSTALVISAIEGMGGVGKTRLAVHVAHQLLAAGRYADHQLYVDLRGHADRPPADPHAVLASFLHLLGVPGGQIPAGLEERSALYRDRLYGKNALVLLDNAADERQIQPLLPAGPTNLVLVTSRRTLAVDGAHTLSLDVFTAGEARELLTRVVGHGRVDADPAATDEVLRLCGHLPLAIALVARRLQSRTTWTMADLAQRLELAGNRIDELAAGTRQLRAVFDLSYRALEPDEQRVFRLLALHPGQDFTADSVAALTGIGGTAAGQILECLVEEHLVTAVTGRRYRLHDLLRSYAHRLVQAEEPEAARREAAGRLLDYYLHTADRAVRLLHPTGRSVELVGTPPEPGIRLPGRAEAERWLDDERPNLTEAVTFAADRDWPAHAWQLAYLLRQELYMTPDPDRAEEMRWILDYLLRREGVPEEPDAPLRRIDEKFAKAYALQGLWLIRSMDRDHEAAIEFIDRAIAVVDGSDDLAELHLSLLENRVFSLQNLDRLTEADATLGAARAYTDRLRWPSRLSIPMAVNHYWAGRWDQAVDELDTISDADGEAGPSRQRERSSALLLLHGVAALIAVLRDDDTGVTRHLSSADDLPMLTSTDRENCDFLLMAEALAAERRGRLAQALDVLSPIFDPNYAPMMLRHQWLPDAVRIAQRAGDHAVAEQALEVCEGEARRERLPARAGAAAAHCRGLIEAHPQRVLEAADHYRDVGRTVELARALEDAAVLLGRRGSRTEAASTFDEAVRRYKSVGAAWAVRRAREQLAETGVSIVAG